MANTDSHRDGIVSMAKVSRSGASILHGPSQPVPIHKTFGTLIREQAAAQPSSLLVASHHQNKQLTYEQVDRRSDELARGLAQLGVKIGDRVAILMGNELEYIESFLASAKLGALITLANYAYSEQELHSVLSSCGATTLILVPGFDRYDYRGWIPRLKAGIPSLRNLILVHGDLEPFRFMHSKHDVIDYESVVASGSKCSIDLVSIDSKINPKDSMNLQFTSGSTGLPKASALTHTGIYNAGRFIGKTMYLTSSDVICLPVPLFHSFGLIIGVATALAHGASLVLPDNKFNIEATLVCIPKYGCTGLYGVTTMFVAEMSHPTFKSFDLSSLRFAILAGSAVPEPLMRKVWAAFGITQTHTNWGLTESSSIVTMTRDTDTLWQRTVSSGSLFPGFSGRVVDPATARSLPRGQTGEIVLRGNGLQNCYYGNELKTSEAHRISPEDGLEWFHTGDEGYFTEEGFFVITGRIKDMIIRGGENISPLEIEERLMAHPSVSQAAVIGVPDSKYGEQICAFVEPARDGGPQPSDAVLQAWVGETLAKFKRPKYVIWLGSCSQFQTWPKTGSGKLRKPDLRLIAAKILGPGQDCTQAKL